MADVKNIKGTEGNNTQFYCSSKNGDWIVQKPNSIDSLLPVILAGNATIGISAHRLIGKNFCTTNFDTNVGRLSCPGH